MKRGTVLITTTVAVLCYASLYLIGSTAVPPLFTVHTEIVLPANAQKSWQVLTDFPSYPHWNPYLTKIEGVLEPGQTITFTLVDGNFDEPIDLSARLAAVQAPEELYWEGTLGIRGIHDTRHTFRLIALTDGSTQFLHFEEFRGVLAFLLPKREQRIAYTRSAFESMNRALQQRLGQLAEALQANEAATSEQ